MRKLILKYQHKREPEILDGSMEYYYPEDNKNHRERLEWAKSLYPYNLEEDLTIITWCPFIAETVIKALNPQQDTLELVFMINDKVVDSEEYFREYASVMRDIQLLNF